MSLTPEEAREEARLNRHLNADPTTAKCIGGLRPAEPVEHNVRVSDPDDPDATLNREEERLSRHVAASNARAKDGGVVVRKVVEEGPKYTCALCGKTGGGQFCMIETRKDPKATVHVDCFVCSKCGTPLAGCDYTEDAKGNFFCDDCSRPQQPPQEEEKPAGGKEKCAKCGKPITAKDSKVRAMGTMYHEKCFYCDTCGHTITSACYKGEGGKLYCSEPCARRAGEGPKPPASKEEEEKRADAAASQDPDDYKFCSACGKELDDDFIVLAGKPLHRDCFKCSACGKKLTNQVFNVDGKMCCKECAEKAQ